MNEGDIVSAYFESLNEELTAAGIDAPPHRPDGFGITTQEYMKLKNCSQDAARRSLSAATKKGLLVRHKMGTGSGANSLVFCRPAEWLSAFGETSENSEK